MQAPRSVLAIDATTSICSVAWTDGTACIERVEDAGQRHSELVLGMVSAVLADASCALRDVDEIAFGAGPGSFTGLRIACGIAQGLAFGGGRRVRGVSSLLGLAEATRRDAVLAVLDARMNEVYWAAYRRDDSRGAWQAVCPPDVSPPGRVPVPPGSGWFAAGDGLAVYPALAVRLAAAAMTIDAGVRGTAAAIAALAWRGEGHAVDAAHAAPEYVRDKVALTTAERASAS